ncbi:MAG: TetR/AcrR family transcriptional regulator [Myxococcota bacterium]
MGRRKTYDRDDVAQRAMDVFWRKGYEAATIQELERALDINRYSLFAEFGSKEGLFEAALEVYEAVVVTANLGAMEGPEATIDDVIAFFDGCRGGSDERALAGCMLCNAAVGRSPDSAPVQTRALRYFTRLEAAFRNALRHTVAPDALDASAASLGSATLGLFVQARGGLSSERRAQVLDGLVHGVRALARP